MLQHVDERQCLRVQLAAELSRIFRGPNPWVEFIRPLMTSCQAARSLQILNVGLRGAKTGDIAGKLHVCRHRYRWIGNLENASALVANF